LGVGGAAKRTVPAWRTAYRKGGNAGRRELRAKTPQTHHLLSSCSPHLGAHWERETHTHAHRAREVFCRLPLLCLTRTWLPLHHIPGELAQTCHRFYGHCFCCCPSHTTAPSRPRGLPSTLPIGLATSTSVDHPDCWDVPPARRVRLCIAIGCRVLCRGEAWTVEDPYAVIVQACAEEGQFLCSVIICTTTGSYRPSQLAGNPVLNKCHR